MIVADANLVLYFLLENRLTAAAERVRAKDPQWYAPKLIEIEIANALAGYVRRGDFDVDGASRHFRRAMTLLTLHDVQQEPHRWFRLMQVSGCTAYDLQYVLLAEELQALLVTADQQVLAAFPDAARSLETF